MEPKEELAALLKTFTRLQLEFVHARLEASSDKEACEKVRMHPTTKSGWPNRDDIDRAILLARMDGVIMASEKLRRNAAKAVDALADVMQDKRSARRVDAANSILNRVGLSETSKIEVEGNVKVSRWLEELRKVDGEGDGDEDTTP